MTRVSTSAERLAGTLKSIWVLSASSTGLMRKVKTGFIRIVVLGAARRSVRGEPLQTIEPTAQR
jgi:hypothetical protein